MKWRFAGSLVMLLGAMARAGAQQDPQPDPYYKLKPEYRLQIDSLIELANQARLPGKSLRLKAIEGSKKTNDGRKVVMVVRNLYAALGQSRQALGPLASMEEVEAGADALLAKVRPQDLALFKVTKATRSPARALTYLSDLVAYRGVPTEEAVAAFAKVWADGAADSDLDGLWRAIDGDILNGVNPKAALQNRFGSLPPRKPPGEDEGNPHS
jgi:hypothetical protein